MPYYVYIIQCDDGSFYTGYSRNPDSRMRLHMKGKGARYLRIHRPEKLVYEEEFNTRAEAMKRERRVKSLNHDQKLKLTKSETRIERGRKRSARRRNAGEKPFV